MWLAVLFTLVLAYFIYYFCFKPYNYWKNRGIVYEVPLPLVGNFRDTVLKKKHVTDIYEYLYNKYSNKRYVGIYIFTKPALLVRDIELVKKICLEEFDHFSDRVKIFDDECDSVIGNILVNLRGKEWKAVRSSLNPAFASSKLGTIFDLVSDQSEAFANHFVKENEDLVEIQLNDTFSKFENGVISSACFGVEANSLEDVDNEFLRRHKQLHSFGVFRKLKLSFIQLFPVLAKILSVKVFPTSSTDYFKKLVLETIQKRLSENKVRHDFFHYFMELRNGQLKVDKTKKEITPGYAAVDELEVENAIGDQEKHWTEDEIVTQMLMFLISHVGTDAILTAGSFMACELALNPDIQVKVQEEIDNVLQNSNGGKASYEDIVKMKYLDCVVSETLRKWPPVYQLDRECVKDFYEVDLSLPDDEKIVIAKGTAVVVPIMAIHRDPNYFPEPKKFNPERFNEENRIKIIPGSYIPFGRGPRSCIGSKFAILEIKLLFFYLLSKFDLVPTARTNVLFSLNQSRYDVNGVINNFLGLKHRRVTSL